jgi:hypothetical protein
MSPAEMKIALQEVLAAGISLTTSSYIALGALWLLGTIISGFVGAFFHARSEAATAEIARRSAITQKRWEAKFECYSRIAEALAEMVSTLSTQAPPGPGHDPFTEIRPMLDKINQFSTVARITVAPQVRTLLSNLATKLNIATSQEQRFEAAHLGWLAVLDVARADLFGEPREMTDEEILA